MNKIQLAEKLFRDKKKKDKREILLNNRNLEKRINKVRKNKKDYKKYNHHLQKPKMKTKL